MFQPVPDMTLEDAYQAVCKVIPDAEWTQFASHSLGLDGNLVEKITREENIQRKSKMCKKSEKGTTVESIFALLNQHLNLQGGVRPQEDRPERPTTLNDGLETPQTNMGQTQPSDDVTADQRGSSKGDDRLIYGNFCEKWIQLVFLPQPSMYPVGKGRKGCALIMNNRFEGKLGERRGSEIDARNMEMLWTHLGCDLYKGVIHEEKTRKEMMTLLYEVSKLNGSKYSYIVVVIMTHGKIVGGEEHTYYLESQHARYKDHTEDKITKKVTVTSQAEEAFLGCDGRNTPVTAALEMFHNTNAVDLQGIPKLFFMNFCRGDTANPGTPAIEQCTVPGDGAPFTTQYRKSTRIPTISDSLVAYPTHSGNTALRDTENGSWFINAITNVFMRYAHSEHVVEMLTRVNDAMALMEVSEERARKFQEIKDWKAMSHFNSSLRKKLYLCTD